MTVLETERLSLRKLSLEDAEFILELLNDPAFLQFVGDKGVRTLDDAREYLRGGPMDSYDRLGFGLYLTALKSTGIPIGICGLLKRDALDHVDIGFALLPQYRAHGYASEAATAVVAYARDACGLDHLVAVTTPDNHGSARVLEKIGMRFEQMVRLTPDSPEIRLYALTEPSRQAPQSRSSDHGD